MPAFDQILFLDIDGVVLPDRAHFLPDPMISEFYVKFDPCSVAILNNICASEGFKIVVHSSWIRSGMVEGVLSCSVKEHCIGQGIKDDLFHEDWSCDGSISWRYHRIQEWLNRHPTDDYVILDDTPPSDTDTWALTNFFCCDEEVGITMEMARSIRCRK